MLAAARKYLAMLFVVALACAGPLAAVAKAVEHAGADISEASHAAANMGLHHHHGHHHGDDGSAHHHHDAADPDCLPGAKDHADHDHDGPCCHVHLSCCPVAGFIHATPTIVLHREMDSKLSAWNTALPHGGIIHPLLRPPRHIA